MVDFGWMGAGGILFFLNFVVFGVLYLVAGGHAADAGMMTVGGVILGCCAGCVNAWYHMYYLVYRARRLKRNGADDAQYAEALRRIRPSHRSLKYQALVAVVTAAGMLALWT